MIPIIAAAVCLVSPADSVKQTLIPSDFSKKVGFYTRDRTTLSQTDSGIKKKPADLANPKYGALTFGNKSFAVITDEPEGKPIRIFVDTNGDGDLSGDMLELKTEPYGDKLKFYVGTVQLDLGLGQPVVVKVLRVPGEPKLKDLFLYDQEFGYEIEMNLDGKSFKGFSKGVSNETSFLVLDLNGDGKVSDDLNDMILVNEPFNYTGTSYILKTAAGKLSLEKSEKSVAKATPSSLLAQKAAEFKATVEWTTDYKKALELSKKTGKPILADFTGTDWCSWCIKLKNEVFLTSEFEDWAKKNVILLELDYPQSKAQTAELKAQNKALLEKYKVRGFPTILFLDGNEKVLGSYGYDRGGPSVWLKKAEEFIKKKA